jgi:hypothetical protein
MGSSDEVRATIQRFTDIGLDQQVMIPATGAVPHPLRMDSSAQLGERVLPGFR